VISLASAQPRDAYAQSKNQSNKVVSFFATSLVSHCRWKAVFVVKWADSLGRKPARYVWNVELSPEAMSRTGIYATMDIFDVRSGSSGSSGR
jgi:hypothetical protein